MNADINEYLRSSAFIGGSFLCYCLLGPYETYDWAAFDKAIGEIFSNPDAVILLMQVNSEPVGFVEVYLKQDGAWPPTARIRRVLGAREGCNPNETGRLGIRRRPAGVL